MFKRVYRSSSNQFKGLYYLVLALVNVSLFLICNANASENLLAKEYYLKAAFLYNFARMVEWPENAHSNKRSPINICFIGNDPYGNALNTIANKKVKQRPLSIKRDIHPESISQCHILFISESESFYLDDILKQTRNKQILTVSEIKDFTRKGGHVTFYISEDKHIRLKINLQELEQSQLKMSSRILVLADIEKTSPSSGLSEQQAEPGDNER
jgi:hypothetical protein